MAAVSELVDGVHDLVSLPEAYLKIRSLIDDPESTMDDFAHAVRLDPGLAARLLRIANSPFFGVSRQVETISLAINLMGIQRLHDLVLTTSVIGAFDRLASPALDTGTFWRHSLHTGILARMLAAECRIFDSERLFIGGLLHDIGHLVMSLRIPEACAAVQAQAAATATPVAVIERQLLGYDYAQAGAELMRAWRFPDTLIALCTHHVEPWLAPEGAQECALVHVARCMALMLAADATTTEPLAACDPRAIGLARLGGMTAEHVATESLQHLDEAVCMLLHRPAA